ncbi:PREDICTED: uncharacterized protein LOC104773069 isoform X2 [Camelina sativa]|uniref:Uncharacterized protein LOC104773069 isoform X2 n=1 Tax=Camelina sativa TaxID=90675 RepID=A0ABM0Y5N9_CAMSA|nr:PREDICTED: uncharacterized protein LOC104773069 isoform X2 [Camelina sativa]
MGSVNHDDVVVVDISSDEEEEETNTGVADKEYFKWLNNVIDSVDDTSDSTDVVEVLSEVKGCVDSQYRKPKEDDDDGDDCVILDGDPDKTTKTASVDEDGDDKLAKNDDDGEDDDDDVLVVGQKGEIACRDFPHPRHSCAKYAFNSTSHEKYCDMCHCYVCDIRAPCPYWSIGASTINHCHANDKEKIWKTQREFFRTGYMPTPPSSKPTPSILRVSQNTLLQNQVGIRPCSSSTRVANPSNVKARLRIRQPTPHNQGLQSRPAQSLSSVCNNVIQRDRSSYRQRSRVAYSAGSGNSIRYNDDASRSSHHSSSVVAPPPISPDMYTQQRNYHPSVSDHCTALPGSQSNRYTRHSDQNIHGSGNRQFVDLFVPSEAPLTTADSQTATAQQQPGTNENVLETKLSEFENWLMDNPNQSGPVSPLPEPVSQDYVGTFSFDFETFLND